MRNVVTLIVGLGSYLLFLITTIYAIAFTLGAALPHPFAPPIAPTLPALLREFGKTYAAYQATTPQLLPFPRKRGGLRALKEAIADA